MVGREIGGLVVYKCGSGQWMASFRYSAFSCMGLSMGALWLIGENLGLMRVGLELLVMAGCYSTIQCFDHGIGFWQGLCGIDCGHIYFGGTGRKDDVASLLLLGGRLGCKPAWSDIWILGTVRPGRVVGESRVKTTRHQYQRCLLVITNEHLKSTSRTFDAVVGLSISCRSTK